MSLRFGGLIAVLLATTASIVYLLNPNTNQYLYMGGDDPGVTCTTRNEWTWIGLSSILMLWTPALERCRYVFSSIWNTRSFNSHPPTAPPHRGPLILSTSRVFQLFMLLQVIWISSNMCPALLLILREADDDDDAEAAGTTHDRSWAKWTLAGVEMLGARAAWPGLWNLAILIFPVQRTSSLLKNLGVSHREALCFHQWTGHAVLFWFTIHTVFLSVVYAIRYPSIKEWLTVMLPYKNLYTEGVDNFAAWVGFTALLVLWLFSLPYVQRTHFELFYVLHLGLAPIFILFATLHDYATLFFVQPALVAWVTDRILRRYSSDRKVLVVPPQADARTTTLTSTTQIVLDGGNSPPSSIHRDTGGEGGECTLSTVMGSSVVCLTLPIPSTWGKMIQPGTFLYLKDTSLSTWQSHPFSVQPSTTTTTTQFGDVGNGTGIDTHMKLHIKALGNWSTSFVTKVQDFIMDQQREQIKPPATQSDTPKEDRSSTTTPLAAGRAQIHLEVEGPYVSTLSHVLEGYRMCWFLAGGIGITGVVDLCRKCQREGRPYHLVWIVRTPSELAVLDHLLIPLVHDQDQSMNVASKIQIFVTSGSDHPHESPSTLTLSDPPPHAPMVLSTKCQLSYGSSSSQDGGGHHYYGHHRHHHYPHHPHFTELSTMTASVLSMALCFLVSRMTSCAYATGLDEDHRRVFNCSLWTHTVSCVHCEVGDEVEQPQDPSSNQSINPCCTVDICYYSFRGIPILVSFLVTPLLALLLLKVWSWANRSLRWFPYYHHPVNAEEEEDDDDDVNESVVTNSETLFSTTARYTVPPPGPPLPGARGGVRAKKDAHQHHDFHVEYRKPNLGELLLEASVDDNGGGVIDDEEERGTAVVVCGSHSLVLDVLRRGNEELRWKHVKIFSIHGLPELAGRGVPVASSCCGS